MEYALQLMIKCNPLYAKITDLKRYKFAALKEQLADKVANGQLTTQEMADLVAAERARWDAIQVDEFSFESMRDSVFSSIINTMPNPLD